MLSHVAAAAPEQARARTAMVESIAFDGGSFQEFGYYVGARMAGDVERAWGAAAFVCVMRLPAEQFVLEHDAVAHDDGLKLGAEAVSAARSVAMARGGDHDFRHCRAGD